MHADIKSVWGSQIVAFWVKNEEFKIKKSKAKLKKHED